MAKCSGIEHCWILTGAWKDQLWWARRRRMTKGEPSSVDFDYRWVLAREESKQDIIGFAHTHPGMVAMPSSTDHDTMRAWYNSLGKSLICVIKGVDGLRGWWYDDDESPPTECQVKCFGSLLVGTTELMPGDDEFAILPDNDGSVALKDMLSPEDQEAFAARIRAFEERELEI